jgi:hypothetical protein
VKRTVLLIALLASACSPAPQAISNNSAEAQPAAKARYALRSNVAGMSLVKVAELPATQALPAADDNCNHYIEPGTAAGKRAAAKGWRVLQEAKFNQFDIVLIARGGDPMTSGRCNYIDSNLAFFEGDHLVGILYPKGKEGTPIAVAVPADGHLRVWSTDPMVLGQVNLAGSDLTFDKVSGGDSVCDGKYRVPTVYGLPYSEARKALIDGGWRALPSKEEVSSIPENAAGRRRFPELDHCAGTGYGECAFTLTAADNATTVEITTLGDVDDPIVSDYSVACGG